MDLGDEDHSFHVVGNGEKEMQLTVTRTKSDGDGYHGAAPSLDGAICLCPTGKVQAPGQRKGPVPLGSASKVP